MFNISQEQANEIGWRRFEDRIACLLYETDEDARDFIHTPAGRDFLADACAAASQFGLTAQIEVAQYVLTAWLLGSDFESRYPAMAEILTSTLPPAQKAEALEMVMVTLLEQLERGQLS